MTAPETEPTAAEPATKPLTAREKVKLNQVPVHDPLDRTVGLIADRVNRRRMLFIAFAWIFVLLLGGGLALDLPIGLFREGYQFDALLIDLAAPHNDIQRDKADTPADILDKIVYLGGRHDVQRVWVAGREVHRQ